MARGYGKRQALKVNFSLFPFFPSLLFEFVGDATTSHIAWQSLVKKMWKKLLTLSWRAVIVLCFDSIHVVGWASWLTRTGHATDLNARLACYQLASSMAQTDHHHPPEYYNDVLSRIQRRSSTVNHAISMSVALLGRKKSVFWIKSL